MADKKISDLASTSSVDQVNSHLVIQDGSVNNKVAVKDIVGQGWAHYADSTYTSISPLAVNNDRIQLTNDALGSSTDTSFLPSGGEFWNSSSNKIIPQNLSDVYLLKLDMTLVSNTNNAYVNVEFMKDGSKFAARTITFPKGTTVDTYNTIGFSFHVDSDLKTNGGEIYIDSTGGFNINVFDIKIMIARVYTAV